MDASLDTDIVIHLYKSNKIDLLFSFCDELYMHEYLLNNELKRKSYTVHEQFITIIDQLCLPVPDTNMEPVECFMFIRKLYINIGGIMNKKIEFESICADYFGIRNRNLLIEFIKL